VLNGFAVIKALSLPVAEGWKSQPGTKFSLTIQFHVDRAPVNMPSLARQHEYGLLA
jgi:hypothetical protein